MFSSAEGLFLSRLFSIFLSKCPFLNIFSFRDYLFEILYKSLEI